MMSNGFLIGASVFVSGVTLRYMLRGYRRRRERARFRTTSVPLVSVLVAEVRKYALKLVSWSIAQGERSGFSDSLRERLSRAGLTTRPAQEGFLLTQEVFILGAFVSMIAMIVAHIIGVISLSVTWLGIVILFFSISLMPHVWVWGKGREHTMRWEEEIPFLMTVFQLMRREGVSDEAVVGTFGRWYGDSSAPQTSFARQMVRIKRGVELGLDWQAMMLRGVARDVSPKVLPEHVREQLRRYIEIRDVDVRAESDTVTAERYCAYLHDTMQNRLRLMRRGVFCLSVIGVGGVVVLFI